MDVLPIERALISVSDKMGLDTLAQALQARGVELMATGGTAQYLEALGLAATRVEEVTGNPEAFDGRVKTLGFTLFGGILYDRDKEEHRQRAKALGIPTIDLVVCNLYPFAEVSKREGVATDELMENIDIGGVSLIRASAKNARHVCVLSCPKDYDSFLGEWESQGGIGWATRKRLALAGFLHTYHYDQMIALTLSHRFDLGETFCPLAPELGHPLRYGENPHQRAKFVAYPGVRAHLLAGKPMSYNNYLDADGALQAVADLHGDSYFQALHCVAVVKHTNPCGLAAFENQTKALEWAFRSDPTSSFGSIVCFNKSLTEEAAGWLAKKFVEVVLAPSFSEKALSVLRQKKNLRLLEVPMEVASAPRGVRSLGLGLLLQEQDGPSKREKLTCVTRKPWREDWGDLAHFGIMACKHLKSNAIALVREIEGGHQLVGAGMGNPNRLVSVEEALGQAVKNDCRNLEEVLAISDAFFPFRDTVDCLHGGGVRAVITPGGSIRDDEVIEACNDLGMAMAFTGRRHFRH